MSVYNKIGGGVNKVLIDNKPPTDRLNLTEVEGIIKNRAKLPFKGFANLAREGNTFYILANNKIYKGNPRKNWTEIADISTIFSTGSLLCIEKKDNNSFRILIQDNGLKLYEVSNTNITLLKTIEVVWGATEQYHFIMNNALYQCYNTGRIAIYKTNINTGLQTDITNQILEEGINKGILARQETESGIRKIIINNKLYIINLITPITIYEFDGEKIKKIKTLDISGVKCAYLSERMQTKQNEVYVILSGDYSSYYKYQTHYLLDKNFNIVDTISTIYTFNEKSYFCIKENEKYTYITREHMYDKVYNLVEFPVKAYVRRE